MAVYDQGHAPITGAARAGALVNYAGALVSCALIVGVGVWGYKLVVRDVSGIPVVRAMAGDMRVLPTNPGGEVSNHTGLSVNEVAAVGEAAAPEDSVALAPMTAGLADEDLEAQPMAEASEVLAVDPVVSPEVQVPVVLNGTQAVNAPLSTNDILALADQIAAGVAPLAGGAVVAPTLSANGQAVVTPLVARNVPGVSVSLRPALRPATLVPTSAPTVADAVAAAVATTNEPLVTAAAFALGTNLVQLGAFPNAEVAATEWTRLQGRFGDVMGGKARVIQAATSGGKVFYRLRAQGFGELGDARRFCAALVAEGTDCIPVVVR
ncbi:MAG: SPOR domain-containing protein [Yoonia sp.]|nr:SPOR domain-containing protein [Yoonia sp.]